MCPQYLEHRQPPIHICVRVNEARGIKHSPIVPLVINQAALGVPIQTQTEKNWNLLLNQHPFLSNPTHHCLLPHERRAFLSSSRPSAGKSLCCLLALNPIRNISRKEPAIFPTRRKTNSFQTRAGDLELLFVSGSRTSRLHMVWQRAWIHFF